MSEPTISKETLDHWVFERDRMQARALRAERERDEARGEARLYFEELLSISKVYCGCDFTKEDEVQGGFSEGLVYAFLEGAFDKQEDTWRKREAKAEADNATLRAQVAGLAKAATHYMAARERWDVDKSFYDTCHPDEIEQLGQQVSEDALAIDAAETFLKEALARCQPASAADTQPEGGKE